MEYFNCSLLSVDAWRDLGGWDWNGVHRVEEGIIIAEDSPIINDARKCLKWFRDQGFLTKYSKGKCRVDFNNDIIGGLLIVIEDKNTGRPLLALSSVH